MKGVRTAMTTALGHIFDGEPAKAYVALDGLTDWDLIEIFDAATDLRDLADDMADDESEVRSWTREEAPNDADD